MLTKTLLPAACATVLSALSLSATAAPEASPSFDCAKARTGAEKAICANPQLAALDASIAKRYSEARNSLDAATAEALVRDQRDFTKVRDDAFEKPFGNLKPVEEIASRMKHRDAFLASLDLGERKGFTGRWRNISGEITLWKKPDGDILYEGSAEQPRTGSWSCNVEASGKAKGGRLQVKSVDTKGWVLNLKRQGDALVVEEQPPGAGASGPPYCGANGSLAGTFFPIR
ncbi:lysozyme inhibitor LprI family protein [Achromobacter spanius]|uniref:lysozyme inhibitor LprI family protein n=1 Tax=Achromobacter spanius TaxID=217203 RepID=UPI00380949D8